MDSKTEGNQEVRYPPEHAARLQRHNDLLCQAELSICLQLELESNSAQDIRGDSGCQEGILDIRLLDRDYLANQLF